MKKFIFIILLMFIHVAGFSQKKQFVKTESGLKYKLVEDSTGNNAKMGDLVVVHLKFRNAKDTFDTYKRGGAISILLQPSFKGSLEEGLTYASKGDSIAIAISNDSLYTVLYKSDSLPKEIKPGTFTTFHIKVLNVYTKEELKKEEVEINRKKVEEDAEFMKQMTQKILDSNQAQLKIDEEKIKDYLKKNKLKAQRTENGIYFVITQQGKGSQPVTGDSLVVHYTGKFLDGKVFDQSKPERPFIFQTGVGAVIIGFDEALMQLKQGSKAIIFIPSPLAYGAQGIKNSEDEYAILPNEPLIFELELVEVNKVK